MSPGLSHRSLSHSISPQQEFSSAQTQTQLSHPTRALQRAGRPEPVHHHPRPNPRSHLHCLLIVLACCRGHDCPKMGQKGGLTYDSHY